MNNGSPWKRVLNALNLDFLPKDNGIPGAAPGAAAPVSPESLLEMQILQRFPPPPRPIKSETQGLGHSDLFEEVLQVTLTHPEFQNFGHRDVSKYWNDMIRSLCAGGNMNNGPEGKKLKTWKAEEE